MSDELSAKVREAELAVLIEQKGFRSAGRVILAQRDEARAQLAAVGPVVAAAWALNEATGVQDAIWRYGRKNDEADALASAVREMGEQQ